MKKLKHKGFLPPLTLLWALTDSECILSTLFFFFFTKSGELRKYKVKNIQIFVVIIIRFFPPMNEIAKDHELGKRKSKGIYSNYLQSSKPVTSQKDLRVC